MENYAEENIMVGEEITIQHTGKRLNIEIEEGEYVNDDVNL